jgi:hypothetical protein
MVNLEAHKYSCLLDWGFVAWADAPVTPETAPWPGPLDICVAKEGGTFASHAALDLDLRTCWPTAIVPSPDRRAFIVLAEVTFDDNHEWWAVAFEITKEGDLREIGRTSKFHRRDGIEMSARWSDCATGVIDWTSEDIPQPPEVFSRTDEAAQAPPPTTGR